MPGAYEVCATCRGRGVIYRREVRTTCPDCGGARGRASRASEQLRAVDVVRSCWRRFERGETGEFNLELAVRTALRAGLELAELERRCGVPMRHLRRVAGGQGTLL